MKPSLKQTQVVQALRLIWPLPLIFFIFLALVGLSPRAAGSASLVLTIQALGGVLVLLNWRKSQLGSLGLVGIGLALGTTMSVGSSMAFRTLLPATWAWAVPTLVITGISVLSRKHDSGQRHEISSLLWAGLVACAGLLEFVPFLRRNPLNLNSWTALYGDISYHEALSHSLVLQGPWNLAAIGQPIRYHWLADAWSGFLSEAAHLGPFVALTRVLPVYALVAVVLISWELGRRLSNSRVGSVLAGFVLVTASAVGLSAAATYGLVMAEWSPTHTIAMPIILSLTVIVVGYVGQERRDVVALVLTGVLAAALVVARAPQAMVACIAGIGVVVLWRRRSTMRSRSIELLLASIVGIAITYVAVVSGGPPNGLTVRLNDEIAVGLGLVPVGSAWGGWLAVPALIAALLAGWAGVMLLLASSGVVRKTAGAWAVASGLAGILFCLIMSQPGGSEITFLWAASVVIYPISGAGLYLAWANAVDAGRSIERRSIVFIGAGVCLGALSVVMHQWSMGVALGGYLRWGLPIALLTLAAIVGLATAHSRPASGAGVFREAGKSTAVLLLVPAALAASLVGLVINSTDIIRPATASTPLALTNAHLEAGAWVQENTPLEAVFATDRQCGNPADTPPICGSMWSGPAALGARQSLVEGYSYSLGEGDLTKADEERIVRSWSFGRNPNFADACYLWGKGVHWFWTDRLTSSASAQAWSAFGDVKFENGAVAIIELKEPSCPSS